MIEVGIRDLRNGLSKYLKRVRQGETITVTEHGEPVARLIPAAIPPDIAKKMADGRVTWSGEKFRPPKTKIRPTPGPPISDFVVEDRF